MNYLVEEEEIEIDEDDEEMYLKEEFGGLSL